MIEHVDNIFLLQTDNTTYAFKVLSSGLLEHMYYGDGITLPSSKYLNKYADLRYEEAKNKLIKCQGDVNKVIEEFLTDVQF